MRFYIDCEYSDAESLSVCLNGLAAHADVEAFRLPRIPDSLTATWLADFPTHASLETFAHLMESIPFKHGDFIRIVHADSKAFLPWTLPQFHKAALVDHIFHLSFQ